MAGTTVIEAAVIESLLGKADDAWFLQHKNMKMNYREHLRHTAAFITSNYARERRRINRGKTKHRPGNSDKVPRMRI